MWVNLPKGERVATTTVTNLGFWVWDFFFDFGILDGTWIFFTVVTVVGPAALPKGVGKLAER